MAPQITTLPNGFTTNTEVGNVAWPTCSNTMSGASPRISLTRFANARDCAEALLLLVLGLAALAHHARELVAVDEVLRAELLDQLALLVGGHDADASRRR